MGGHTAALSLLKAGGAEPSAVLRGSGEVSHIFVPVLSLFGTSVRNITEFVCFCVYFQTLQEDVFHATLCAYFSGLCFDI